MPGDRTDRGSCPASINYLKGEEPDLARGLGQSVLADALRPFVEPSR